MNKKPQKPPQNWKAVNSEGNVLFTSHYKMTCCQKLSDLRLNKQERLKIEKIEPEVEPMSKKELRKVLKNE